jgi:cellulose synthase/poly-beta-1,6-N-acetylglucosamine synthase-like glycosyltransferase
MFYFLVTIFSISLFLCVTTYFLYPIALLVLSKIKRCKINNSDITPTISIIISAYNEEKDIAQKITNTLNLDYPKDKLEILVGSDGSTDNTAELLASYDNPLIHVFNFKSNRGKTTVQNELVSLAVGEILVFTDAASFLPNNALRKLINNFSDETVGCVAGKMRFIETDKNVTTQSQGIYWKYEVKIRELESKLGSLIGVDGPLYAVRAEYYIPLPEMIISDLITPLLILEQGKKVIIEPEAIVEEEPTNKPEHELKTRRRITLRGLVGVFFYKRLLNPLKYPWLSLQIICHKLLRWFVGPLVIINFISSVALFSYQIFPFTIVFWLYLLLFCFAFVGWLIDKAGKKNKIFTIPYYFLLVNTAATLGILDFIQNKKATTWATQRSI